MPEAHKQAAEEVRAHLVSLRGGAPFLSPRDAALLVKWLSEGVDVGTILRALERAAESRRKRKSRIPLSLMHAKRHLGKPTRGGLTPSPDSGHPLAALARALQTSTDARQVRLRALGKALISLPSDDPDALVRQALAAIRTFFDEAWAHASESEREALLAEGREALGDLTEDLDDTELDAAIEAHARDCLRQAYPLLTAATIWDLVEP